MPDSLPLSVVIPAYDRADMLPVAIASIRAQQPAPPAEIVVVDDASSDATAQVAESLGARVIRHEVNSGAATARNTGVAAATHEWVAMLDSDDEWLPHHLETLWRLRGSHDLVAGAQMVLDAAGTPVHYHGTPSATAAQLESPAALYPVNFIAASGVLVRRDAVLAVGGYRSDLRFAEDLDLWIRLLDRGTGIATPEVVTRYHVHAGQKSLDGRSREAQRKIVEDYRDRAWWTPELVERQLAFRAWDAFRAALREGRRGEALREVAWFARRPSHVTALLRLLDHRRRARKRVVALVAERGGAG